MAIIALGCIVFAVRGYHDERLALHFRDFKEPYGSARCMTRSCDPYDEMAIYRAWVAAGGVNVEEVIAPPFGAVYPPSSITLLAPLAMLSVPVAEEIWKALIAVTFTMASLLVGRLCLQFGASVVLSILLAGFTMSSTILIMLGQVSGVVIPLLVIWFACLMEGRWRAFGTICLFLATMLKPQECVFLILCLLVGERAWQASFVRLVGAGAAWVTVSTAWISIKPGASQWWRELVANLGSGHHPGQPISPARGTVSGFEQTQLGDLFAAFRDSPEMYNLLAWGVCAVLFAVWVIPAVKLRNTPAKHVLCAAALSCLTLLPVYHRQYDTRILLLTFPAIAYLLSRVRQRRFGLLGLCMVGVAVISTSHSFLKFVRVQFPGALESADAVHTVLFFRPLPLTVLALLVYFLVALYRELRIQAAGESVGELLDQDALVAAGRGTGLGVATNGYGLERRTSAAEATATES